MHCDWKLKLRSHNANYCSIEVVANTGLTVYITKLINYAIGLETYIDYKHNL